jgi:hypothetical protein
MKNSKKSRLTTFSSANLTKLFNIKKLLVITLLFACFTAVNAQVKPLNNLSKYKVNKKITDNNITLPLNQPLNLVTIKNNINNNSSCYLMSLSTTVIIPPKNGQYLKDMVGYFVSGRYIKVERNYLRVNELLLRSDKNFSKVQGNNFEVLIYPDSGNPKEINKRMVKLSWKLPETGNIVQTFQLRDVNIVYKTYGILITGNYEINGVLFGVSIGITPTTCLI